VPVVASCSEPTERVVGDELRAEAEESNDFGSLQCAAGQLIGPEVKSLAIGLTFEGVAVEQGNESGIIE